MLNLKTLNEEIKLTEGLKSLVETYEAIAASSMRRIRSSVLENRAFHLGLSRLYQEIKASYSREVERLLKAQKHLAKNSKILSLLGRKDKLAFVFLSANTGLYGDIIGRTFNLFKKEAIKNPGADLFVVGKIGRTLAEEALSGRKIVYLDFPDTHIAFDSLKEITKKLHGFEKVVAFHGVFKSFADQKPTLSNISGDIMTETQSHEAVVTYLFEPSLDEVAAFFEEEIFASLFEQAFHESRLAKLSSRMMLLDHASQNIEKSFDKLFFQKQRSRHLIFNKKQLDAISGLALWSQ